MIKQKAVNASAVPRIMKCGASSIEPDVKKSLIKDYTELGTAIHEIMERHINNREVDLKNTAKKFSCDETELKILYFQGKKIWEQMGEYFPTPWTELKSKSDLISAYIDVISFEGQYISIADWKSGWMEGDYWPQLYANALLAGGIFQEETGKIEPDQKFYLCVFWLRTAEIDPIWITWRELLEWKAQLEKQISRKDQYTMGPHCDYCPRITDCPAITKSIDVYNPALPGDHKGGTALTTENIIKYRPIVAALKNAIEQFDFAQRAFIRSRGPIDLGDGKELAWKPYDRKTIHLAKGWDEIKAQIGGDAEKLISICKISNKELENLITENAERGKKKEAKEKFWAYMEEKNLVDIQEAGALRTVKTKEKK